MTRKFLHILMAVLMIAMSSGININMHFCSEKLVSVTIAEDNCNSCCHEESNKCCVTITEHFQLEELFLTSDKKNSSGSSIIIHKNQFTDNISRISNFKTPYLVIHNNPSLKTSVKLSVKQSYLL